MSRTQRLTDDFETPRRRAISLIDRPRLARRGRACSRSTAFISENRVANPTDRPGGGGEVRGEEGPAGAFGAEPVDEGLADLDQVDREVAEVAERRVARPEVVER